MDVYAHLSDVKASTQPYQPLDLCIWSIISKEVMKLIAHVETKTSGKVYWLNSL
jgi:hypothetical protein